MRWMVGILSCGAVLGVAHAASVPSRTDLEDVSGVRALDWVRTENRQTQDVLESDPRYKGFYQDVLAAEEAPERLALPVQLRGQIYNFWQDAAHRRGIWRRTAFDAFVGRINAWETVLDIDALTLSEKQDWVFQGADCNGPSETRCLIRLSQSGEDADTVREFDLVSKTFVNGGFVLPRGKQTAIWQDADTLVVARPWEDEKTPVTRSGYPYIVKILRRGESLSQAREALRGTPDDMSVELRRFRDETGATILMIERKRNFFESVYYILDPKTGKSTLIALPARVGFMGFSHGRLVTRLDQDWTIPGGALFHRGSIVSVDPRQPQEGVETIFVPGPTQTTASLATGGSGVTAIIYDNVQPRLSSFAPAVKGAPWKESRIALPKNTSAKIVSADRESSYVFIQNEGYIVPPKLQMLDAAKGTVRDIAQTPDLFKAADLVTEQFWVRSKDGTRVPYFVVHKSNWHLDGQNPVLQTSYGGFDLSYLPTYYPDLGKTWFERGGVYVVGSIRGGGEFGPAWHEAGMKSGRQRAYDDFASIAQDLFRRGVTTPAHLGIRGRSNGGLLMGVEFTQHPDFWKAVIIGVPLLDMLHYETMAAGASWNAEYGRMANPRERTFLEAISPLQHLKAEIRYPEPFIFTSTKDDRVGPVHARLFAARLEALGKPFYYYEDTEGGHAGTVNAREVAHERALEAVYLSRLLMDAKR